MIRNDRGFSAAIIILTIIAVTVIGFTGYYVWNTQNKDSDKPQNSVLNESKVDNPEPTAAEPQKTEQNYLVISEWGVKLPLSDLILNSSYTKPISTTLRPCEDETDATTCDGLRIEAVQVAETGNPIAGCGLDESGFFRIARMSEEEKQKSDEQDLEKKIGNYYYGIYWGQAECYLNANDTTKYNELKIEYEAAFNGLENI